MNIKQSEFIQSVSHGLSPSPVLETKDCGQKFFFYAEFLSINSCVFYCSLNICAKKTNKQTILKQQFVLTHFLFFLLSNKARGSFFHSWFFQSVLFFAPHTSLFHTFLFSIVTSNNTWLQFCLIHSHNLGSQSLMQGGVMS